MEQKFGENRGGENPNHALSMRVGHTKKQGQKPHPLKDQIPKGAPPNSKAWPTRQKLETRDQKSETRKWRRENPHPPPPGRSKRRPRKGHSRTTCFSIGFPDSSLRPVLSAVKNAEDFHGVPSEAIDSKIRKAGEYELAGA